MEMKGKEMMWSGPGRPTSPCQSQEQERPPSTGRSRPQLSVKFSETVMFSIYKEGTDRLLCNNTPLLLPLFAIESIQFCEREQDVTAALKITAFFLTFKQHILLN